VRVCQLEIQKGVTRRWGFDQNKDELVAAKTIGWWRLMVVKGWNAVS